MADPRRTSTRRAVLSYNQLKDLTSESGAKWPDLLVKDYQGIIQDFAFLADTLDTFDFRIIKNEDDIVELFELVATNAQNIIYNEYRMFGGDRPSAYDEGLVYVVDDYTVYPTDDPQNYYICIEDTLTPAGAFDPLKWAKVSIKDNRAYIDKTRDDVTDNFVLAGYGQIGLDAITSISDISAGVWQTLPMDIELLTDPRYVTYNLINNSLAYTIEGIWSLNIKISLDFDEVNAGRELNLRFYNLTTATAGAVVFREGVGRNTSVGGFSFQVIISTDEFTINDEFVLQVSGDSSFTTVSDIGNVWGASHISEAKFL